MMYDEFSSPLMGRVILDIGGHGKYSLESFEVNYSCGNTLKINELLNSNWLVAAAYNPPLGSAHQTPRESPLRCFIYLYVYCHTHTRHTYNHNSPLSGLMVHTETPCYPRPTRSTRCTCSDEIRSKSFLKSFCRQPQQIRAIGTGMWEGGNDE